MKNAELSQKRKKVFETMHCDQCNPMIVSTGMIKNVFLHEKGCPNDGKQWNAEEGVWERWIDCFECGYPVREGEICSCQEVN